MFEYLMSLLDSRASRMTCPMALLSVHADMIGGDLLNYKMWYFAAYYDIDADIENKKELNEKWRQLPRFSWGKPVRLPDASDANSMYVMDDKWREKMAQFGESDCLHQLALFLLIWGEANNIRFTPECLCFIFKCAWDYYVSGPQVDAKECDFLDLVITPIYNFLRDQQLDCVGGAYMRKKNADHSKIICYDDVNLFFWSSENLVLMTVRTGEKLHSYSIPERYSRLLQVDWSSCFVKTYLEKRSWMHLVVNFNRIWIIHLALFWYFISLNTPAMYTKAYNFSKNSEPAPQVQLAVVSLGGAIACFVCLCGLVGEWMYVPRKVLRGENFAAKLVLMVFMLALNVAPAIYIFMLKDWNVHSHIGTVVGTAHLVFSIVTTVYLSVVPSAGLFFLTRKAAANVKRTLFTLNFAPVSSQSRTCSVVLWISVFLAKMTESYFFLALSMKDPLRILVTMDLSRCSGDIWLGNAVCLNFAMITAALLILTNFTLFFLDAYLWYIICNCVFSAILSYSQGTSIFKPWKSKFGKLPERILNKIYFHGISDGESRFAIFKIWNCIVISLYKEHLLSIEQANKLVYLQETEHQLLQGTKKQPIFFSYQEDSTSVRMSDFFATNEEASRRISFFARSLLSQLPPPTPIESTPAFTVLACHYSEKIILSMSELLKENPALKVSILEYLKRLHRLEWKLFVKDLKLLTHANSAGLDTATSANVIFGGETKKQTVQSQLDDIPFEFIGFKFSLPEYEMRTRLWASVRYQTLFRTISGFYNYERALKVLYYLETYNEESEYLADESDLESELDTFARRKFRLLVSMQKLQDFSEDDQESVRVLFESFPNLHVSYLEKEIVDGAVSYYSVLLHTSHAGSQGLKKFRIKLSGNPILGDGKADNQNHAIVFHRGEYLQTIDANQDNYIEECLKIRSVLAEFDEMDLDPSLEYVPGMNFVPKKPKVAMVGAREHIFSESIGVLGDVTAGKEQTFGTLFARTLSTINAKLHYGHPDFINGIFMCTRGGISKAQKGLHLNEDIYAGMNAVCRGGIIKHCDYYQCGKGRDLGFDTILNFTTKIGAGMGEQLLSREVYYMGTRLAIDRFLLFYYAHAGFHVNNMFILYSVNLFMAVLMSLGALKHETIMCVEDKSRAVSEPLLPFGCYDLVPVLDWVNRFVLLMFICLLISFLPLVVQELTEKGVRKMVRRVGLHFFSLAPLFEVVTCNAYARAFIDNLHFGGARYVPTGRGIATTRRNFSELFQKYAHVLIYPGVLGVLVVVFATISMWQPALLWFYLTFVSLCFAPFVFNPHQFAFGKFMVDYGKLLKWFGGGVLRRSGGWPAFKRAQRRKFTGRKKNPKNKGNVETLPAQTSWSNFHLDVGVPVLECVVYFLPYLYITAQTGVSDPTEVNPILRILVLAAFLVAASVAFNFLFFLFALTLGNLLTLCFKKTPLAVAAVSRVISVIIAILTLELVMFVHQWNAARSLCALIAVFKVLQLLENLTYCIITKELDGNESNKAWWSGRWKWENFGFRVFLQPFREFCVKTVEMCLFGFDFIVCHLLLYVMLPLTLFPWVDRVHTTILFWTKSRKIFRDPILSARERRCRNWAIGKNLAVFLLVLLLLCAVGITPYFSSEISGFADPNIPNFALLLFQPNHQRNNDTGNFNLVKTTPELQLVTVA